MTVAAVGFQCPECIRDGRKTVRQARTIAGAPVSADSPITRVLLGLNVGVFLLIFLGAGSGLVRRFGMDPRAIAIDGEYYRVLTAAFMHESMLHIAFNMYALMMLGDQVERVLGRWRYIALYLVSALGGSAVSYVFMNLRSPGSIGASGAIFGLFGALFVIQKRLRADTSSIMVVLLLNLFIGFVVPGIDWRAHVGGLITGALITAGYVFVNRGARRAVLHAAIVIGVLIACAAIVVVHTDQLRDGLRPAQAVGTAGTSPGRPSQ